MNNQNRKTEGKLPKCKCNFNPPRPFRTEKGRVYAQIGSEDYLPMFFCNWCKGVNGNDTEFIKEIIKLYSGERWGSMEGNPHYDKDREIEWGYKFFSDYYKNLL